jgi:hypothetical protein
MAPPRWLGLLGLLELAVEGAVMGTAPPALARNENNVAGSMPNPRGNPRRGIVLLGVYGTAAGCQGAAQGHVNATSWTYHHCDFPPAGSGNYSCHCYARTDGCWHPKPQQLVDSGYLAAAPHCPAPAPPPSPGPPPPWKGCTTNLDCQLNGKCSSSGVCRCDPAWTGQRCERLDLLPASAEAGLQDPRLSSWGGSVLQNTSNGEWHMFAAVIERGCGLAAWRPNSALGHATAPAGSPEGPYTFQSLIKPHFAHEPVAVRAPDGTILIYHIGAGSNDTGPGSNYAANCTHCTGADHKWTGGGSFYGPTSILFSHSLDGPWQSHDAGYGSKLPRCPHCGDTNPAVVVSPNGSVSMMWRTTNLLPTGSCPAASCMAMASASSWNSQYHWAVDNIFAGQADATHTHVEDAHMWLAPAGSANPGSYHAVFHSDAEHNSGGAACGHGYSVDGVRWTFSSFNACNHTVQLRNGSTITLRQRERPHLVMDQHGTPIVLTNGAGWKGDCDHVFTFAQPINTKPHVYDDDGGDE